MFGHHDKADHVEPITATGLFERSFKDILRMGRVEVGLSPITSESDEVETVGLLEPTSPQGMGRDYRRGVWTQVCDGGYVGL